MLQERYWVLRGREAVKKFTRSCVICRKHEGTLYGPLPLADLPSNRGSAIYTYWPRFCQTVVH